MRLALTPSRAARLIQKILPQKDITISTNEIVVETEETFLDLMAAASFDHAFGVNGVVRWRVALRHEFDDVDRNAVPRDALAGWKVERFNISRST